ncbi:MAG: CPBP family intramembrane metalloprotease [Chitinophagaceae bacterium]|nr:CPBP family intramembrane metalloprotease [Chitinophagaceae bacterium]
MQGAYKTESVFKQLLIFGGITLASFFVIGVLGTLLLAAVTGTSVNELNNLATLSADKSRAIPLIRGMQLVQFVSLFLIPALISAKLFSTSVKKYLGWRRPSHPEFFFTGAAVMLLALPLGNWLGEINRSIPFPEGISRWINQKENEIAGLIKLILSQRSIKDLLLNLIFIALLAAVGEELFFRGIVQRLLIKWIKHPMAGIVITAILFSALHAQFYGFLPRLALGILLGMMYWYSGSLWVAITAHFVYDAVLIVAAYFYPNLLDVENIKQSKELWVSSLPAALVSLLLVLMLMLRMHKMSQNTYESVYADDNVPVKNHPFDFPENTPE